VTYGYSRRDAILRMRRAVSEYKVLGIKTTLPFFERVLHHPDFLAGDFDTSFVQTAFAERDKGRVRSLDVAVAAAAISALRDRQLARPGTGNGEARCSPWVEAARRDALGSRL